MIKSVPELLINVIHSDFPVHLTSFFPFKTTPYQALSSPRVVVQECPAAVGRTSLGAANDFLLDEK